MSPRRDVSMSREEITEFLDVPRTAVLTTLDRDGWPHSTAMWFVPDHGSVLMWTYAKSQKAVNLRRDPRAALLVEDGMSYAELRGVLIQGEIEIIDDYETIAEVGVRLYQRYSEPELGVPVTEGPILEIEKQAHKRLGLRMSSMRVASWDHRRL